MKPRFVIAMLLVLALAVPVSMLAQGSKADKEIRAVIDELTQANLKGGAEAVQVFDKYLGDDMTRILANGKVFTKAEILEDYANRKTTVEALEFSDVKIRLYGNTAVVTGIQDAKATGQLASGASHSRWTRVLVNRGGIWQVVLFQNTRIAP
jgi:hypothetical protein